MKGIRYYLNPIYNNKIEIKECNSSLHSSTYHLHNEISIGLIEKGSCYFEAYNKTYVLHEKTILLIPAKAIHKCTPFNIKTWNFKMIYINEKWLLNNTPNPILRDEFSYKKLSNEEYIKTENMISNLLKMDLIKEGEALLKDILTIATNNINTNNRINNINNYTVKMDTINNYINKFYLQNISLEELSDFSNLNKFYIVRQFKKMYGIPPHKYINSLKIDYSKILLKKNKSLAEIALELGFYDQSHFSKIFKEFSGISPMKYKKSIKN